MHVHVHLYMGVHIYMNMCRCMCRTHRFSQNLSNNAHPWRTAPKTRIHTHKYTHGYAYTRSHHQQHPPSSQTHTTLTKSTRKICVCFQCWLQLKTKIFLAHTYAFRLPQTHTHTNTHKHKHTHTHTRTHACTHTHKHTFKHTHMCLHRQTHMQTHKQTHTHTHTIIEQEHEKDAHAAGMFSNCPKHIYARTQAHAHTQKHNARTRQKFVCCCYVFRLPPNTYAHKHTHSHTHTFAHVPRARERCVCCVFRLAVRARMRSFSAET